MTEKTFVLPFDLRNRLLHLVDLYIEIPERNAARAAIQNSAVDTLFTVHEKLAWWTSSDKKESATCKELEDWLMKTME